MTDIQTLRAEGDPGFLVDVVTRRSWGTLAAVYSDCDWDTALEHAEAAFARGLSVRIEESDAHCADAPFPDEFDRQQ